MKESRGIQYMNAFADVLKAQIKKWVYPRSSYVKACAHKVCLPSDSKKSCTK